jgi:hypothetical protein
MPQLMLHPGHFDRDWSSLLLLSQLMLPYLNVRGTGIGRTLRLQLCCYTTNAVDWVVRCSNHCTILSSATTSPDLPVPAPRHGSPPVAVPRLAPFLHRALHGSKAQKPSLSTWRSLAFCLHHATGRCSLPSCWTFQFNIMGDVPGCARLECPHRCYSCFPCL